MLALTWYTLSYPNPNPNPNSQPPTPNPNPNPNPNQVHPELRALWPGCRQVAPETSAQASGRRATQGRDGEHGQGGSRRLLGTDRGERGQLERHVGPNWRVASVRPARWERVGFCVWLSDVAAGPVCGARFGVLSASVKPMAKP